MILKEVTNSVVMEIVDNLARVCRSLTVHVNVVKVESQGIDEFVHFGFVA